MEINRIITLTTDFGMRDSFVGVMKGVILSINPRARIIDISHEIPQGDIATASFVLHGAFRYFPKETIHTIVVDPGVGSERRPVAVEAGHYFFVAPDNGVLSYILDKAKKINMIHLTNVKYFLNHISNTFHGRDVFAPVAAHLSTGIAIEKMGESISDYHKYAFKGPKKTRISIEGEITYVDHFGNLISNIAEKTIKDMLAMGKLCIRIGEHSIYELSKSYSDTDQGHLVALINSFGLLEIAIREENAAQQLHLNKGAKVIVEMELFKSIS